MTRPTALALAVAAAALSGCASYRADPPPPRAPVAQADTAGPARVGLAATMEIPENPYGDSAVVGVASPEDIASGAAPMSAPGAQRAAASAPAGAVDPSEVTVSRYYYQDEGTYYYQDVADDLDDYGQGADDAVYYGGYHAGYYRYGDPAYYPSPYRYYRPYGTYRSYASYGWYPTWRYRRAWTGYANPYYAGYYDPWFYDPWAYDPWYGPTVAISVGWGGFGTGRFGYGGYGAGYADGFYAGRYGGFAGYYGPGYYGRPRSRGYTDYRRDEAYDDGRRSRVRGLARTGPIASTPDPSRDPSFSRQPARRGLAPARLPAASGITRSTGRRLPAPERRTLDGPSDGERRVAPGREVSPPSRTGRTAPPRQADTPTPPRAERPARTAPPSRTRPAPFPSAEPAPRRETRPAPVPRRESRPAPPPRRESRPAPPPAPGVASGPAAPP